VKCPVYHSWVRRVKERLRLSYQSSPPLLAKERGTQGVRLINKRGEREGDTVEGGGSRFLEKY